MIIKLLPPQIAAHWDLIRHGIEVSLPPTSYGSEERMKNIFEALMEERMQCWCGARKREDGTPEILGYAVTVVTVDPGSGVKNLLIYCLYAMHSVDNMIWIAGFETLKKFAKSKGCHRVIGYSNVDRLIYLVKGVLGGKADYTFLSLDV